MCISNLRTKRYFKHEYSEYAQWPLSCAQLQIGLKRERLTNLIHTCSLPCCLVTFLLCACLQVILLGLMRWPSLCCEITFMMCLQLLKSVVSDLIVHILDLINDVAMTAKSISAPAKDTPNSTRNMSGLT